MKLRKMLKTLSKNTLIVALLLGMLLPAIVRAEKNNNQYCDEVANTCNKALLDADKVIDLKTKQITLQDKIIAAQDTRIVELEKSKNSIFNSPILYGILGAVVGALIVK